jgi:Flp pilus assembly protein TadG
MSYCDSARRFVADRGGNVAITFGVLLIPLVLAAGTAVDFSRASGAKAHLQSAADAAVLAAAAQVTDRTSNAELQDKVDAFLAANSTSIAAQRKGAPRLTQDHSELCIDVVNSVPTAFLSIANIKQIPVATTACAGTPADQTLEVALVLDVSSSMIEQGRFEPMKTAVADFLNTLMSDQAVRQKSRVAIVPFSSRVNIGLTHKSWLRAYGSSPAVPERWTDPRSVYNSSYSMAYWIDGVTPDLYNSKNYYWMGCIEPRADVEMNDNGAIGPYGLTDATPKTSAFVPMDANDGSSKSFCPPPIVPLSNDLTLLGNANSQLTSEGSTRLDAGMVAGWYVLSPSWNGLWGSGANPANYSTSVRKIVLFMTDGQMNTQYGYSEGKFDWLCKTNTTSACNTFANDKLVSICGAMKAVGIEIYAISYDKDADSANLKSCATDLSHFFSATKESGSSTYIADVYTQIAKQLVRRQLRITK